MDFRKTNVCFVIRFIFYNNISICNCRKLQKNVQFIQIFFFRLRLVVQFISLFWGRFCKLEEVGPCWRKYLIGGMPLKSLPGS